MTNQIAAIVAKVEGVEAVKPWNDRHYINLSAARGSRANADLKTKLWIKDGVLTIEQGKGYHSDAYITAKHAVIEAVKAAGGTVREI